MDSYLLYRCYIIIILSWEYDNDSIVFLLKIAFHAVKNRLAFIISLPSKTLFNQIQLKIKCQCQYVNSSKSIWLLLIYYWQHWKIKKSSQSAKWKLECFSKQFCIDHLSSHSFFLIHSIIFSYICDIIVSSDWFSVIIYHIFRMFTFQSNCEISIYSFNSKLYLNK